jgi:hypothetical protein
MKRVTGSIKSAKYDVEFDFSKVISSLFGIFPINVSARKARKIFSFELILFTQRKLSVSVDRSYTN